MNRRSFFKVLGAIGAAVAAPTMLLEATAATPANAVELGLIREISCYDIAWDGIAVRWDIYTGDEQYAVDMRWDGPQAADEQFRNQQRALAKEMLEAMMQKNGIRWSDLKPLPIPKAYEKPAWTV